MILKSGFKSIDNFNYENDTIIDKQSLKNNIFGKILKFFLLSSIFNFCFGSINLILILTLKLNTDKSIEYRFFISIMSILLSFISIIFISIINQNKIKQILFFSFKQNKDKITYSKNNILEEENIFEKNQNIKFVENDHFSFKLQENYFNKSENKINKNNTKYSKKVNFYNCFFYIFTTLLLLLQSQNLYTMQMNVFNMFYNSMFITEFNFKPDLIFFSLDIIIDIILMKILEIHSIYLISNSVNVCLIVIIEFVIGNMRYFFMSLIFYILMKILVLININKNSNKHENKNNLSQAKKEQYETNSEIKENENNNYSIEDIEFSGNILNKNFVKKNHTLDYFSKQHSLIIESVRNNILNERNKSCENFRNYNLNFNDMININKSNKKDNFIFSKFKNNSYNNFRCKERNSIIKNKNMFNKNYKNKNNKIINNSSNQNSIISQFSPLEDDDFLKKANVGYIVFSLKDNKVKKLNNFLVQNIQYFKDFTFFSEINFNIENKDTNKDKMFNISYNTNTSRKFNQLGSFKNENQINDDKNLNFSTNHNFKPINEYLFVKEIITNLDIINNDIDLFGETRDRFYELLRLRDYPDKETNVKYIKEEGNSKHKGKFKKPQRIIINNYKNDYTEIDSFNLLDNQIDIKNEIEDKDINEEIIQVLKKQSDISIKNVNSDVFNLEIYSHNTNLNFDKNENIAKIEENGIIYSELLKEKRIGNLLNEKINTNVENSIQKIQFIKTNNSNKYINNDKDIIYLKSNSGSIENTSHNRNESKDSNINLTIKDYEEKFMISPREKYINNFNKENKTFRKRKLSKENKENNENNENNHESNINNLNFNYKKFCRKSKIKNNNDNNSYPIKIPNNLFSEKINNDIIISKQIKNDELLKLLINNKDSFKKFTFIGNKILNLKSEDNNEINQKKNSFKSYISLEIFIRVNPGPNQNDANLEILINDITKNDLLFGVEQYIISSCQFLHDFKNPLFCIIQEINDSRSNLEKILKSVEIEKKDKNEIINKYKFIKETSEFCQGMILSYENFSKLLYKPKNFNLDLKVFKLIRFLKFFKNLMNIFLKKSNKNVQFLITYKVSQNYFLKTDENKLKQILLNLLSNSEKFTLRGKIELKIEEDIINNKNYIKFTIEDTGIGMDLKRKKNLFTPFNSQDRDNLNPNGMGLGLVIVNEISGKLGLPIEFESKIGFGTKCWFFVENLKKNAYETNNNTVLVNNKDRISINNNDNQSINKLNTLLRETIKYKESEKKFKFPQVIIIDEQLKKSNDKVSFIDKNNKDYIDNTNKESVHMEFMSNNKNKKIENINIDFNEIHKTICNSNETDENYGLTLSSLSYDSEKSKITINMNSPNLEDAMKMDSELYRDIRNNLEPAKSDLSLIDAFYVDLISEGNSIFIDTIMHNRNSCNIKKFNDPLEDHINLINFKRFLKKTDPRKKVNNRIDKNQIGEYDMNQKINCDLIKSDRESQTHNFNFRSNNNTNSQRKSNGNINNYHNENNLYYFNTNNVSGNFNNNLHYISNNKFIEKYKIVNEIKFNILDNKKNLYRSINLQKKFYENDEFNFYDKDLNKLKRFSFNKQNTEIKDFENNNTINNEFINSVSFKSKELKKLEVDDIKIDHINHPYSEVSLNLIKNVDNLKDFYVNKSHLKEIISNKDIVDRIENNQEKIKL